MRRIGFGTQEMVPLGTSSSHDNKSLAGFEELAMPLFDSLYNFARWLVHNQNDGEDLVQETYLKALRSFASFRPGTNFRAWIFKILKNTFLSSCSKLERRMTVVMGSEEDFPMLPATSASPESLLIERSGIDAACPRVGLRHSRNAGLIAPAWLEHPDGDAAPQPLGLPHSRSVELCIPARVAHLRLAAPP